MADVTFRLAQLSDWARLYAWRNDPEACEQFLSGPVTLSEHMDWLRKTVADERVQLFVVTALSWAGTALASHTPVATCRIDADGGVSIAVAPEHRRKGYASVIASHLVGFGKPLYALVKVTNIASLRAFASAGFTYSGVKDGLGIKDAVVLLEYRP